MFVFALLSALAVVIAFTIIKKSRRPPLPPGPPGLPVLGNALQLPTQHTWLTLARWAETYGPIMHVSILGNPLIIISSREVISELLEKRGAIYSDRPVVPMSGVLAGFSEYIAMTPYVPRQKEGRKLIQGTLNARNAPMLHAIQEAKAAQLARKLFETPSDFRGHIRWLVASTTLQITYGISAESFDDPLLQLVEKAMQDFTVISAPGAFLVDSLPFLMYIPEWFPGAGFKRFAREVRELALRLGDQFYNTVKEEVASGTAVRSFVEKVIVDNAHPTPEEEELCKRTAVEFFGAGSDTTVSIVNSFFVIMAQNPSIQRHAQVELDALTGCTRLPKCSDRKSLPYLEAVLKEVHRWNPVGPLGLPHQVRQDDYYAGYRIPAGSTVIANTWSILHDSSLYPNPEHVDPERYLGHSDESLNPDPRLFAFGYGRRSCPGQMLAEDVLFIAAATALALFDISDAVPLEGSKIEYGGDIISHPCPYKCTIMPRSTPHADELRAACMQD